MWESAAPLLVAEDQRRVLEGWRRAPSTPQGVALRASVILMAADGVPNRTIAKTLGVSRPTVLLWRERFARDGPKALTKIEKGRGRKPSIPPEKVKAIIEATFHRQPPGATHWSCRTMAKAMGVSPDTVNRIWRAHELQPHRVTSFKLSNDPRFVEKLTDVVGLYLNPPEHAIVLCVDEHPRFQLHFIPTGSSWLNLIERWFAELTNKAIRRGSFAGVGELVTAIHAFLDASNQDPTVYVWTASAEAILEKVARCQAILQTEH